MVKNTQFANQGRKCILFNPISFVRFKQNQKKAALEPFGIKFRLIGKHNRRKGFPGLISGFQEFIP